MKLSILLGLGLTLCLATGVGMGMLDYGAIQGQNMSAYKSILANSSAGLNSYRFIMEMEMKNDQIDLLNQTEPTQNIFIKTLAVGGFNQSNRSMKMVMAQLVVPTGDEGNSSALAIEEYILNDTVYIKVDGNWTAFRLTEPNLWAQQDEARQQLELLNRSEMALLGSEAVDGQDCYKIRVVPDMQSYARVAEEQLGPSVGHLNMSQFYKNSTMDVIYWVREKDNLLAKTEMFMTFNLIPESLGSTAQGPDSREMQMAVHLIFRFMDFNQPVRDLLPAAARGTEAVELNLTAPERM
jgi:hypothetical protein